LNEDHCQPKVENRAAFYIDGFNLYHPIHEMNEPHLKWANLWKLGELICEPHGAKLVKVVFCTAVPAHLPESRDRHNTFNAAQRANGVHIVPGHHIHDGEKWNEKQSDINVALHLILDGVDDIYDMAILLSADSDQAATAKIFKERFAGKRLLAVAPPTKSVPNKVHPYCFDHFSLPKLMMERCVMGESVAGKTGAIMRPPEYARPDNWVHPDDRPKGKPPKAPKKWGPAFKA
jgi:hypothetical protein